MFSIEPESTQTDFVFSENLKSLRALGPEIDFKTFLLTVLFSLGFHELNPFKEKENFVLFPFSTRFTYDKFSVYNHKVQRAYQPVVWPK